MTENNTGLEHATNESEFLFGGRFTASGTATINESHRGGFVLEVFRED